MIISKCPLRVSLVGGSTDLQSFIDWNGRGSVISFPITLYSYLSIGYSYNDLYKVIYSKIENVKNPNDIVNDIAREVIKYFDLPPVKVMFDADIPSHSSGLASSSSYTVAFVSAVSKLIGINFSQFDICRVALEIERKFNPLTGYQDTYGCGIPSLKRMNFYNSRISISYLDDRAFSDVDMYLINTNIVRKSNNILSTISLEESKKLLAFVNKMEKNILDINEICRILNKSWEQKKKTSNLIINNDIIEVEDRLKNANNILGMKLCGAGGGGYFLLICKKGLMMEKNVIKIDIDKCGVISCKI